jgi:hypothetical protein
MAAAGACLLSLLLVPDIARADGCSSLLSSINQLKAQIPREPRDAANDDRQVLTDYVGLYNDKCTGNAGRPGGGGGAPYRGGGNNPANALGAAANALGALGDLLDDLDRENQEEAAREQEQQYEREQQQIQEEIANAQRAVAERAAAAQARAAQAALDAQQRQAVANPFGSNSGGGTASGGSNPFAAPTGKSSNPFATTASAAPPPAIKSTPAPTSNSSSGASQSGFKTDAQIKTDCANSGNPSVCQMVEMSARSSSPAYKKYVAAQKKEMDKEIAAKQKTVQDLLKKDAETKAQRKPPETIGSLPAILAGLPVPNDEGLECGPAGHGRRQAGQCLIPDVSPGDCAAVGGNFDPGDDDHPTPFCATSAPANPMTAHPGPHEGEQCGDAAGHIHGGACWALGITRDDCATVLHGITMDNGGFQYCAYDAGQLDAERDAAAKEAAEKARLQKFKDDLANAINGGVTGTPGGGEGGGGGGTTVPPPPPPVVKVDAP